MRVILPTSLFSLSISLLHHVAAEPVTIPFQDCFDEIESESQKLQVHTVYAQVSKNMEWGHYMNLTVFGTSPKDILGLTNTSGSLSTLFTTTSVLTLNAWSNSTYLCRDMRPPSPLPGTLSADNTYCPIAAGPFAFSTTIPWGDNRELTTLITRLRAVDPFGKELLCVDVLTTPLEPLPYGRAKAILWATVGLTIAYWVVVGLARIASAWNRGISRSGRRIWARAQSAGYILASAISGERLTTSPALLRFCTPSMRDVIFHTQWCAVLAMVAVEWPQFIYPLLTQTAWATLAYNVTLVGGPEHRHWDPVNSSTFSIPSGYADQIADPNSPVFLDRTKPNVIYSLPPDAKPGISSFAYTLGIRPQELFPICLILFLSLMAGTIVLSFLLWLADYIITSALTSSGGQGHNANIGRLTRARSPTGGKELSEGTPSGAAEESKSLTGSVGPATANKARFSLPLAGSGASSERGISSHRAWWKLRSDIGAFHGSVLHGNLVRILVLFHLPVTVFSCYQMTLPRSLVGSTSIVLAALSFVVFSILLPLHLVIRVTFTTTNKLYDQTKTLLSLGPLYNHYRHGSQLFALLFFATNIAFGVTIGAGQKSGTAQAIIILVVEVISALVTSIWLPWGSGASMGLISFLFCVARIVIAVLMVILTQAISIGAAPGGWIAYGILIILALVYLALLIMLLVKIVEGLVRLFGGIGFDKSKRTVDSGLLGALSLVGCCGRRRHQRRRSQKHRSMTLPPRTVTRDSDLSSYTPPVGGIHADGTATPPRFLSSDSRKDSTHSQPPSVLKPEHVNKPYAEDSDDEGFIMGAWQPFPPVTGYAPVSNGQHTAPVASTSSNHLPKASSSSTSPSGSGTGSGGAMTGFSRVGGGRAHIDSPYAITTGSTHTFPSVGQQSQIVPSGHNHSRTALPAQPLLYGHGFDKSTDEVPLSLSNVEAGMPVGMNGLPAGAMQPAHIRTKSQTAIVEDYVPSIPQSTSNLSKFTQAQQIASAAQQRPGQLGPRTKQLSEDALLKPPVTAPSTKSKFTLGGDDNDDESGVEEQNKKKWYHLRRNRPHSSEGRTSTSASGLAGSSSRPVDEEMGGIGASSSSTPPRSFVVIRKPPGSMGRLNAPNVTEAESSTAAATYPKASSRPPTR